MVKERVFRRKSQIRREREGFQEGLDYLRLPQLSFSSKVVAMAGYEGKDLK